MQRCGIKQVLLTIVKALFLKLFLYNIDGHTFFEKVLIGMQSFFKDHLHQDIADSLVKSGFLEPTPVQKESIPHIIDGRDLMAAAKTGTGKTAAYLLPIFHKLMPFANTSPSPAKHPIRILILAPTRELTEQILQEARRFLGKIPLSALAVYGGTDPNPQRLALQKGVEILVATPGRLLDHLQSMPQMLRNVSVLVLDEADRMLDMGFMPDIQKIVQFVPPKRQNLLFSATFAEEIKRLALTVLRDPVQIQVSSPNTTVEKISQVALSCPSSQKEDSLLALLRQDAIFPVIVFVNTKSECSRLARSMANKGWKVDSIHGDKTQSERDKAIKGLKEKTFDVLVATDVAARGLDIQGLPMVINFHIPHNPEDYVHRIGRTGRANQLGRAYSFVSDAEMNDWLAVEAFIKQNLPLLPSKEILGQLPIATGVSSVWFYQPYQPEESIGSDDKTVAKKQTALKPSEKMPALFDKGVFAEVQKTRAKQKVSQEDGLLSESEENF